MSSNAKQLNQIIFAYGFFKNTLILSKYNSTNNNGKKRGREEKNKRQDRKAEAQIEISLWKKRNKSETLQSNFDSFHQILF